MPRRRHLLRAQRLPHHHPAAARDHRYRPPRLRRLLPAAGPAALPGAAPAPRRRGDLRLRDPRGERAASALRSTPSAALAYVANWSQIWGKHSYFAQFGPPSPLRHVWSLAVEEQWYPLWPTRAARPAHGVPPPHRTGAGRGRRAHARVGLLDVAPGAGVRRPVPRLLRHRHPGAVAAGRRRPGAAAAPLARHPRPAQAAARRGRRGGVHAVCRRHGPLLGHRGPAVPRRLPGVLAPHRGGRRHARRRHPLAAVAPPLDPPAAVDRPGSPTGSTSALADRRVAQRRSGELGRVAGSLALRTAAPSPSPRPRTTWSSGPIRNAHLGTTCQRPRVATVGGLVSAGAARGAKLLLGHRPRAQAGRRRPGPIQPTGPPPDPHDLRVLVVGDWWPGRSATASRSCPDWPSATTGASAAECSPPRSWWKATTPSSRTRSLGCTKQPAGLGERPRVQARRRARQLGCLGGLRPHLPGPHLPVPPMPTAGCWSSR